MRITVITFFIFLIVNIASANERFTLSGFIRDASTGEELIGTTVYIKDLKAGTSTNVYGFYSLTVPGGNYTVRYSTIGYEKQEIELPLNENIKRDIELAVSPLILEPVIVTEEVADENITKPEMSSFNLQPVKLKTVPIIFGEQDILKTIQLMPGVREVGEGQSGFTVRGGSPDQNLLLLDEAIVYNASHLLGFFSVFNSDAIKNVNLMKGSASARYGGRLSSVLDMKMKEGNSKKFSASGGIGLISSRLTFQGPIIKDKSSFIVSGRRTYVDFFLRRSKSESIRKSKLYFYDLNLKSNYKVSGNDRIFLSAYTGRDVLGFKDEFGIDWGNITGTFRWNHLFNDKLFLNSSLIYSKYDYNISITNGDELIDIGSSIKDINLKEDFQFFHNSTNTFNFGLNAIYHTFLPGEIMADGSSINELRIKNKYALESALYYSHEVKASDLLSFNYGLHLSSFSVLGPGDVFTFDEDGDVTDVETYTGKKLIKFFGGIEPRFSVNYLLDVSSSVKASYARNKQYMHLLSASSSSTPFDIWHPSTKNVKPGVADQIALGYFRNFDSNNYETSLEVYYKNMRDQVDYKNGADIYLNEQVEAEMVFGKAWSYGAELLVKKNYGKLTGWLGYTLSRTRKKFPDINDGNSFPSRQDRTHDLSLVANYKHSKSWTFSANWIYYTGNAVTFPSGKYYYDEQIINMYTERNSYRMPAYHRLDLGATWSGEMFSWNFSLYNAYGRKNAYAIMFRKNEDDPTVTEAVRVSLFSFFPSITMNFRW
ncbi:MAG: TonB-dependent receptor [candidate division Zixibacteria bacterium]|nr:TonB-dependent receptor [candidate division Zixibacteria bacterium]